MEMDCGKRDDDDDAAKTSSLHDQVDDKKTQTNQTQSNRLKRYQHGMQKSILPSHKMHARHHGERALTIKPGILWRTTFLSTFEQSHHEPFREREILGLICKSTSHR